MELTLNTSDCGGRSHVPIYGIISGKYPKTLTIALISTCKKITRPCLIRKTGKAGKLINYINNPGQRGFSSLPL